MLKIMLAQSTKAYVEAADTTTLAAEEEGEEVHVEGITPADKLLYVKRG